MIIFSLLISGCSSNGIKILESKSVNEWRAEDKLSFENITVDEGSEYLLVVEHSEDYSFENLYIKVIVRDDENNQREEIISLDLMNDLGHWVGKQSKNGRTATFGLPQLPKDNHTTLSFDIYQYSREEILTGIISLGIAQKANS